MFGFRKYKDYAENIWIVLSIYVIYTIESILNEKLTAREYSNGARFKFPYFLNCLTTFLNLFNFQSIMELKNRDAIFEIGCLSLLKYIYILLAFAAIQSHGYRTIQAVGMLKLLPICIIKMVVYGEKVATILLCSCFLTTLGVITFSKKHFFGDIKDVLTLKLHLTFNTQFLLIVCLLLLIGVMNTGSDRIFKKYNVNVNTMLFYTSFFTFIPAFFQTINNFSAIKTFITNNPIALAHIGIKTLLNFGGLKLVYVCVKKNGSMATTYILLIRKVLTLALQSLFYGQPLYKTQWAGLLLILAGLVLASFNKKEKKSKEGLK